METKKPKQASGGARLKAAGKSPVLLGVPEPLKAFLLRAAGRDGRPLSQLFLYHTTRAAEKILGEKFREPASAT